VNGKAIMSGVKLTSLESDDMLDVLHYMFEEDMHVATIEEVQSISRAREIIYRDLYNKEYKYSVTVEGSSSQSQGSNGMMTASGEEFYPEDGLQGEDPIVPFDPNSPSKKVTKGYIPPSEPREDWVKPFGINVDAPLN
jgi:hypothetical protein